MIGWLERSLAASGVTLEISDDAAIAEVVAALRPDAKTVPGGDPGPTSKESQLNQPDRPDQGPIDAQISTTSSTR